MGKIISESDERNMVNAIEKAASLALVKDNADRSELLADCLKEAAVPERFAKTAAAAFNKRLTVLTFSKRADAEKAQPFALAEPERVLGLVGGSTLAKAASAKRSTSFSCVIEKPRMAKAASAQIQKRANYEDRVDEEVFKKHISSLFEKQAALLTANLQKLASAECHFEEDKKQLASYLTKAAAGANIADTACNLYGESFTTLMSGLLPETALVKSASGAVRPADAVYDKIEALIEKHAAIEHERSFLTANAESVTEFGKSASAMLDLMQKAKFNKTALDKEAADTTIPVPAAPTAITPLEERLKGIKDPSKDWGYKAERAAWNFIPAASAAAIGVGQGALNAGRALATSYADILDNQFAKLRAIPPASASPGDIAGANFILNDRYLDRLLGWSDMSADPGLAVYPAEEVFTATQRAMDLNPALERPDNRELLKVNVGKLLAQNNRASAADMAELATTLKALSSAKGTQAGEAADAAKALAAKTAPEKVELPKNLIRVFTEGSTNVNQGLQEGLKVLNGVADALEAKNKERDDKRQKQYEEARKEVKDQYEAEVSAANALQKRIDDINKENAKNQNAKDIAAARDQNAKDIAAARDQNARDIAADTNVARLQEKRHEVAGRLVGERARNRANRDIAQAYIDAAHDENTRARRAALNDRKWGVQQLNKLMASNPQLAQSVLANLAAQQLFGRQRWQTPGRGPRNNNRNNNNNKKTP